MENEKKRNWKVVSPEDMEKRSISIHRLEQTITALNNAESWLVDDVYKGDEDIKDLRAGFYQLREAVRVVLKNKEVD